MEVMFYVQFGDRVPDRNPCLKLKSCNSLSVKVTAFARSEMTKERYSSSHRYGIPSGTETPV
ncbi:hypothetical protein NG791_13880 [Laspinema sp. D1]|uniref:hypothetical protein n=1 Tax=Laspinema palackyanum TaxID=3231601 RepID=UPI0034939F63|nr:hypothetical protein [Laspinema sp. D2b]